MVKEEKGYQRIGAWSKGCIKIPMEANKVVAHLETRLKVIARITEHAHTKTLPRRKTETIINPSMRMQQPRGHNPELISSFLGENSWVNLPTLQLSVFK